MQICKDLGLRVRDVPAKGFDGVLIRSRNGQKGIIAVNGSIREYARKRFTIAHEIGHFIIPHHRLLGNVCEEGTIESFDSRLNRAEVEANEFAAELLLPTAILKTRFNLNEFSLHQIAAVAAESSTSLTATMRSFLEMTALPCALVWSVANQAQWCARSDSFKFFLPLTELPSEASFAARIFKGQAFSSEFVPVPANAWLDNSTAERVPVLLEHSIPLPNYTAVLTMLWAYKIDYSPEEHENDGLLEDLAPEDFTLRRRRWPR